MRVLLLAALGCAAAAAAPPPLGAQAGRISYDTFSLANGLRVITSEDHSTPVVAVDVWYNTGSRNERPGRSGFAHLFEHMMFQGSAHVKKAEHFQLVERAGGNENGSTQEDRTNYFEVLPSNRLNLALWLEADRMRSLAITQENFENQRETVKEERRLRVDNQPYARAFVDGLTLPFDSTGCFAYAHSVIGDMADLNAATLPDVQAFFETYYAPNNATLAVVGDFNPAELRRLITQYYTSIPSHPAPAAVTCDYRLNPGLVRREFPDEHANLPAVIRLYRVPPHDDADTPAIELMNIILGQGESSRLNIAIVRRAKAALGAGAGSPGTHRGPGTMFVFGIANQGVEINHLDSLLAAQVDTIRASGVTADELTKAKNTFRARFIENRETVLNKAEELHHYAMFHPSLAEMNSDLDHFMAVTNDDIRRVAAKYLDPANAVILVIKPTAGGGQ
jgi:zinc protease